MNTDDILGCEVSTRALGNFHSRDRRGYLESNRVADLCGS
jgi:hypothetical protein